MNLPPFSARTIAYVIDAYSHFPGNPIERLERLLEIDTATSTALLDAAKLLGLIDAQDQVGEMASLVRDASVVERRELIRFYVERFAPFAEWKRRVAQGYEPLDAARHVKAIYEIEETPAAVRDWFLDLGLYCGSLKEEPSSVVPVTASIPSLGSLVGAALSGRESVIEVLSDYLGQALWRKLPEAVQEHLIVGLEKIANNEAPDEAIREAGMAVDKYMEDVGQNAGAGSYAGLTMGQTARQLLDEGLLVGKQEGFTSYAVNIRNAAEHPDTDVDLAGDRWVLTGKTAVSYLRVALDFMRSANAKLEGRFEI